MNGAGGVGGVGASGGASSVGGVSGASAPSSVGSGSSPVAETPSGGNSNGSEVSAVKGKGEDSPHADGGIFIQQNTNISTHESISLQQCNHAQEPQGMEMDMKKLIEMLILIKLLEALSKGQQ
jgi:hypothetical protein